MRKLLSLCLMFALLVCVVSVYAEQTDPDVTGDWEMTMYGDTVHITLNEDGKMVTTLIAPESEGLDETEMETVEGTWEFDGKTLRLVSDEGVEEILKWENGQLTYAVGDEKIVMERAEPLQKDDSTGTVVATEDGPSVTMTGGWESAEDPTITQDMEEMLWTALDAYETGTITVSYTPVAYLGSQVVAGTNHAILCQADEINKGYSWVIVFIYEDLQGQATIMNIADLDFGTLCTYGA